MLAFLARLLAPRVAVAVLPPQTLPNKAVFEDEASCFDPDCRKGVLYRTADPDSCYESGYPVLLFGDEIGPFDSSDSILLRRQEGWKVKGHFVDHPNQGGLLYANSDSSPDWEVVVDRQMILRDSRQRPLIMIRPSPADPRAFEIVFARGYEVWSKLYRVPPLRPTWAEAVALLGEGKLPEFYPPRP